MIARTSARLAAGRSELRSERVARQLRIVCVEDERAPDAERAAEAGPNTALSRGAARRTEASVVVQSSWANTNAAKSTSGELDEPVEGDAPG